MTITHIQAHPEYQKVLKDSFGGVMYDLANVGKYDTTEIMPLWDNLTDSQKDRAGGIMKGAFEFLKETR